MDFTEDPDHVLGLPRSYPRAAAMTQRPRPQTRPLDGLRVLDLAGGGVRPARRRRILADLGADVVRAELPGTDVTQAFGR